MRSTALGCEAKYELTKKRCQGGIFSSEIEVFGQEFGPKKRVIYVMYQISENSDRQKTDKIELMMTKKKGRQKFWAEKLNFFPKTSLENLAREIFFLPQSLRQCLRFSTLENLQ